MNKVKSIKNLEDIIMIWSLTGSKSISDAWPTTTGENSMPWKSNFVVRSEMTWFLLHMMARYAFDVSPSARDILQDKLVPSAIQRLVAISFKDSHNKKGFDSKGWEERMKSAGLEEFNEAELDYSSCKTLWAESKGDLFREDNILGKLAARINNLTGLQYNIRLRLLIRATATESLAKSGLKEHVKQLIEKGVV